MAAWFPLAWPGSLACIPQLDHSPAQLGLVISFSVSILVSALCTMSFSTGILGTIYFSTGALVTLVSRRFLLTASSLSSALAAHLRILARCPGGCPALGRLFCLLLGVLQQPGGAPQDLAMFSEAKVSKSLPLTLGRPFLKLFRALPAASLVVLKLWGQVGQVSWGRGVPVRAIAGLPGCSPGTRPAPSSSWS